MNRAVRGADGVPGHVVAQQPARQAAAQSESGFPAAATAGTPGPPRRRRRPGRRPRARPGCQGGHPGQLEPFPADGRGRGSRPARAATAAPGPRRATAGRRRSRGPRPVPAPHATRRLPPPERHVHRDERPAPRTSAATGRERQRRDEQERTHPETGRRQEARPAIQRDGALEGHQGADEPEHQQHPVHLRQPVHAQRSGRPNSIRAASRPASSAMPPGSRSSRRPSRRRGRSGRAPASRRGAATGRCAVRSTIVASPPDPGRVQVQRARAGFGEGQQGRGLRIAVPALQRSPDDAEVHLADDLRVLPGGVQQRAATQRDGGRRRVGLRREAEAVEEIDHAVAGVGVRLRVRADGGQGRTPFPAGGQPFGGRIGGVPCEVTGEGRGESGVVADTGVRLEQVGGGRVAPRRPAAAAAWACSRVARPCATSASRCSRAVLGWTPSSSARPAIVRGPAERCSRSRTVPRGPDRAGRAEARTGAGPSA